MRLSTLFSLFLFFSLATSPAAIDWPQLQFTTVATNLISPVSMTHAGDGTGRLFVVEQAGIVKILGTNSNHALFLNITNRVKLGVEQGLLCVTFPPDFSVRKKFYVNYTRQPDGATVISRFSVSADPNVADSTSEEVILLVPQPAANHNGGQMAFGPDGFLYIAFGDGGGAFDPNNNAQNPKSLLGKLLRIDVSSVPPYTVPADNPFVSNPEFRPEIWALGLRNPWRFSFDRETGDLYIADVGQDFSEEINFQPAESAGGQNYGWKLKEGSLAVTLAGAVTSLESLTSPVVEYERNLGASVTGGYVCRASDAGRLAGVYFFGDYMSRRIFGLKFDGTWQMAILGQGIRASTFGEDEAGRVYVADHSTGTIFLIDDNGATAAPAFSPAPGNSPSEYITINCLTPGATIRYTLEARDPIQTDPSLSPGQQITITNGSSIRAQAFQVGLLPSAVSSGTFNFIVGTPEIAGLSSIIGTAGGAASIPSNSLITITCPTPNATIRYTLDSTTPTTNSPLYTVPFKVSPTRTLRARAFRPGFAPDSAVRSVSLLSAAVPMPGMNPAVGPVSYGTNIRLGCAYGAAAIFYTLDGTDPTTNSILYTAPFPILENTTVKARAFLTNYQTSPINSIVFNLPTVATPVFTPGSGPATNGGAITITCATPGSDIFYTIDEADPTTNSMPYIGPVVIQGNTRLKARAFAPQQNPSVIRNVFYQLVKVATPTFSPLAGPVTNGTSISISCATVGAQIFYTVDGTEPLTNSIPYETPFTIDGNTTVRAIAVAPEHDPSVINTTFFALQKVAKPVFNPSVGPLTNGTLISIETATPGATIRFTIDGTAPSETSPAYSVPLIMTDAFTLQACAFRGDLAPSDIPTAFYGLLSPDKTVVTTVAGALKSGFLDGSGLFAQFYAPQGICVDSSGNLYVADTENHAIRKVLPSGEVITIAGTGVGGFQNGPATNAQFLNPIGIAVDKGGNVYVAERNCHQIRKIDVSGIVSTYAQLKECYYAPNIWQIDVDPAGNIYAGHYGNVVKVASNGIPTILTGLDYHDWRVGIGLDAATNVYASVKYRIARVAPNGLTETFAGSSPGFSDGPRLISLLQGPMDTAVDSSTNIYIADINSIKRISPDGWVSTFAGSDVFGYRNGRGIDARFNSAFALCTAPDGNVYVADAGNNCIRKISRDSAGIGIPDNWQLAHFGTVGIDPSADPDGDEMSNYEEFWAGTDPHVRSSALIIRNATLGTNNCAQLTWSSVVGKRYNLKYSSDLITWNDLLTNSIPGTGSNLLVTDPTPMDSFLRRYYRVFVEF